MTRLASGDRRNVRVHTLCMRAYGNSMAASVFWFSYMNNSGQVHHTQTHDKYDEYVNIWLSIRSSPLHGQFNCKAATAFYLRHIEAIPAAASGNIETGQQRHNNSTTTSWWIRAWALLKSKVCNTQCGGDGFFRKLWLLFNCSRRHHHRARARFASNDNKNVTL